LENWILGKQIFRKMDFGKMDFGNMDFRKKGIQKIDFGILGGYQIVHLKTKKPKNGHSVVNIELGDFKIWSEIYP